MSSRTDASSTQGRVHHALNIDDVAESVFVNVRGAGGQPKRLIDAQLDVRGRANTVLIDIAWRIINRQIYGRSSSAPRVRRAQEYAEGPSRHGRPKN